MISSSPCWSGECWDVVISTGVKQPLRQSEEVLVYSSLGGRGLLVICEEAFLRPLEAEGLSAADVI